jgi:GNAT superfamily N-acetyltransferase
MMLRIHSVETDEDVDLTKGLLEGYLASWFEFDGPIHEKEVEAFQHQLRNLADHFGPPDGYLLLARYGEEVAGCVALKKLSNDVCEMKRLYVRTEFRGLKIGRQLAEAIIEQAKKIGCRQMLIHTISAMKEANGLYRSLGFAEIEPYEYSPREDAVFMELKLG